MMGAMDDRAWEQLTTGEPPPAVRRGATEWVRLRLARDLHDRFFQRIGLQAFPIGYGPGPGTLVLASPFCARAPRFFGKLADGGIATDSDHPPDLPVHKAGGLLQFESKEWNTWNELLAATIDALDLGNAHVSGHASCHHRSSKALYPLMFELAVAVASLPGGRWREDVSFEWVRVATHAGSLADKLGVPLAHWERHLAVYRSDWRGVLLSNDGVILGWNSGSLDAGAEWRAGASVRDLVARIVGMTGFDD
jgi:hypothetical protein